MCTEFKNISLPPKKKRNINKLNELVQLALDNSVAFCGNSNDENLQTIKILNTCYFSYDSVEYMVEYVSHMQRHYKYSSNAIIKYLLCCGANLFTLMNKLSQEYYNTYHTETLIRSIFYLYKHITALHINSIAILAYIEIYLERLLACNHTKLTKLLQYSLDEIAIIVCILPIIMFDDDYPSLGHLCRQHKLNMYNAINVELIIIECIRLTITADEYFIKMVDIFDIPLLVENDDLIYLNLHHKFFDGCKPMKLLIL